MNKISAVIITFNEERNIERCLRSLQGVVDEIIVVDSFSKDNTAAICKSFNAIFFERKWDDFSATKNFGNEKAINDWVLSLDADEALSDELKGSILETKSKPLEGCYSFNRLTNYCGHWIRHSGWYPDTKTRLFNKKNCKWQGAVHETLVCANEKSIFLKGDILHYSYYSIKEHLKQTERYSTTAAQMLFDTGKRANVLKVFVSPVFKFIKSYFLKLGFLDGKSGVIISAISAWYVYLKWNKVRDLERQSVK